MESRIFFKGCLLEFLNKNKEIIIAGDYNLNLLDIYKCPCVDCFFNNVLSAEFIPLINLPTRFSKKSASLIDNFFFKASKAYNSWSEILLEKFSDHKPCIASIKLVNKKASPKIVKSKNKPNAVFDFVNDVKAMCETVNLNPEITYDPHEKFSNIHFFCHRGHTLAEVLS